MDPQRNFPIDNKLFKAYTQYQLCKMKNSMSFWNSNVEKDAMMTILENCQYVDRSKSIKKNYFFIHTSNMYITL